MGRAADARAGTLTIGLALAGALPCAALAWPDAIPREVAVLAFMGWAGALAAMLASRGGC